MLVMPDSFKGSLSSEESAKIIRDSIKQIFPECDIICIPVADGGEGSIDAFLSVFTGKRVYCETIAAHGGKTVSSYGEFKDFAVIETASAAGLTLMGNKPDVFNATTFGMGEQILSALIKGYRKIILCLGGSATNDAGCGMASALGAKFIDANGNEFIPVGKNLADIDTIDLSGLDRRIAETEFISMCDIDNTLYGKKGAAYVFGPQKGAKEADLPLLDLGLRVFEKKTGQALNAVPGAGAAGGLGAGTKYFLGAELKSGIDILLDLINFEELAKGTDLILTGEGSFDSQSLRGKVPVGIAKRAERLGIPVIVICGSRGNGVESYEDYGISAVFDITPSPMSLENALLKTNDNLKFTVTNLMRLIKNTRR